MWNGTMIADQKIICNWWMNMDTWCLPSQGWQTFHKKKKQDQDLRDAEHNWSTSKFICRRTFGNIGGTSTYRQEVWALLPPPGHPWELYQHGNEIVKSLLDQDVIEDSAASWMPK